MSATIHIQVMIYSIMMENGFDFLFLHCVFILSLKPFQVIIEYRMSYPS